MGVSWHEFWELTPHVIKIRIKAHNERLMEFDRLAWHFSQYTLSAVSVAVEHNLAGRKAKSKYVEKPLMQGMADKGKPMSEEELQRQRELFVAKLEVMKANFELNHKDGRVS